MTVDDLKVEFTHGRVYVRLVLFFDHILTQSDLHAMATAWAQAMDADAGTRWQAKLFADEFEPATHFLAGEVDGLLEQLPEEPRFLFISSYQLADSYLFSWMPRAHPYLVAEFRVPAPHADEARATLRRLLSWFIDREPPPAFGLVTAGPFAIPAEALGYVPSVESGVTVAGYGCDTYLSGEAVALLDDDELREFGDIATIHSERSGGVTVSFEHMYPPHGHLERLWQTIRGLVVAGPRWSPMAITCGRSLATSHLVEAIARARPVMEHDPDLAAHVEYFEAILDGGSP